MRLWRISEFADLSGLGGKIYQGRWHSAKTEVVYCSDHPSTSLLEILVHNDREDILDTFQLLEIVLPDGLGIHEPELPANWAIQRSETQKIGNTFLSDIKSPLMRIPSIVMPQAWNYLLNPAHPDAAQFRIAQSWRYPFDSRLLT
jgi:RES domain-containing protein